MRKFVCIILLLGCVLFASADPGYNISYTGATTFCQGGGITLNANGAPAGATFQWTKNTANIVGATSSSFTISNAAVTDGGAYSVVINGGAIHYDTVNIVVNPNPTADFNASATTICISTPVSFTNTSSGSGLSYSWNFGDPNSGTNNTSTATNPTHRFIGTPGTTPQTFRVRLTVTSNTGCISRDSVDITVNQSPGTQLGGPEFQAPNNFVSCGSSSTNFTFLNMSSTLATNVSYRIIWGDGSPDFTTNSATNWTTTHSFGVGSHPIQFIVTGAGGCIDTATYIVFVGTNPAVGIGNPGNTSICSGDALTFPITGTATNSPGTVYNISFNNGFDTSFVHPPAPGTVPSSITHIFNVTSCGTTSNGFQNSYAATITATNPCGTSQGSVVPIYVSSRPEATFVLGPRDTVCVNNTVTLTSTSPVNNSVNSGNGTCTPGRNVWTITPSTGYTVTSGSLGNTFGFNNPNTWTNGSSALGLNFNTPGSYTIRLITGNSTLCQLDTAIRTICVNPQPTSNFTIDNAEGCTPVNVATTNNSNTPICGDNTYTWTVTYSNAQGCTPNSSNYTITSGSLTSANPSFQFVNPGVYTITLVTRNSSGACVSTPTSRTVTVKSRPNASIAAINPICQFTSATPVATVNNCYSTTPATYAWTFQNGTPATATTLSPGAITFNTSGTHNITLDVTNECGVTQAIRTIQVNPRPDVIVPANLVLCPGEPTGALTFSSGLAGTTFSWTNSNTAIGLAASGNGSIATFNVTNASAVAITSTITVTASNGGCTNTATFTITVNPRPLAPAVTTPVTYCQGATATALTATATAGNTLLWYTTSSGGVGSATAPTPSTATAGTTNYYVSQVNTTTNCESNRSLIAVTINPSPVITTVSGSNPTSCSSTTGSITLTGLAANTSYSVSYVRNGGAPVIITRTSSAAGNIVITSLSSGTYTSITVTLNGCPSPTMGPVVLSDPSSPNTPTITTNANAPICSGTTLTLSANTSSGAATYNWGGPNGFTSNIFNPTITNVTTAASGVYTVTATISGCTSPAGSVTITIDSTPAVPTVGSNTPLCTGNTLNLTSNSATAGVSYSWTGPGTFTSNVQNPTINNVAAADAGNYIVTVTLGNCSSNNTTTVAVNPTPVIGGSNSTNPTNCASLTGTITLTGLIAGTYNVSYVRNGAAPTVVNNLTANASGEITITGLSAGSYTNIFITRNGCNSAPLAVTITLSDPTPPVTPTITTNAPICSGNTLTLEANTTSGAATYTWNGPNGFTSNIFNPTIANVTTAASGLYTVTASINGCTSPVASQNITINQTPAIPTVGSNSPVCSGNTLNLTASSATAGVSYSWTGPNTFSSAVQNPTRTNVTTADGGSYIVTATLGSCTSTNATPVTINPTPVIGGSSSTNPTNCASSTGTITLTGLVAGTYTVSYVRNGAAPTVLNNVTANASGEITITGLSAGAYTNIFVTLNGCVSAPIAATITLSDPTPPATPTIITNAPVCSGNTLTLEASTTSGAATFAWGGPNGFTSNIFNPTITNVSTAASGNYTVTATINGCTSPAGIINITINPTPAIPTVGSNSPVCTGNTLILTAASTTAGVSYSWTGPNTFTSTLQNPTRTNVTTADAGSYSVTATLGTCSSNNSTPVVINPTPVISGNSFTNPTNCATATGTITLTGLTAATSYTVSFVRNGGAPTVVSNLIANASGEITITALSAGVYTNIFVTLNGCNSTPLAATITLSDPTPPATPVATTNAPICSGNLLELFATSASAGSITYTWSGPNNFTSTSQNPTIASATLAANGTYNVTATLNSCVSPAGSVNVVINETPSTPVASNNGPICADSTLNLTASTTFAGAVSWLWNGPNTFTSSSQNPSIASTSTAANGTYNVIATATTGNCPSAAGVTNVVINPTPVISSASFTNPILCLSSTGTIVLNGLAPSTAFTVTYTRNTAPVTATITSEGTGSLIIPLLSAGTYADVRVTTLAGCPSNTVGPFVLVDPNPPAAPTAGSNSPICTGETLTLNANTVTPGAITYTWSGPAAFSSNVQNPSIINATPANSGTYTVTATLNNCVSPPTSVLVEVTALPSPPTVTSPVNYCIDAPALPLTATTVPGNTLRWYTSAVGGTGTATAPTPTTNATGVTTYYVSQVTALGCEGSRAAIDVIVNPDALAEFVASPLIECAPFNIDATIIQPTVYPTRNNVYNWYANDVLIGTGTTFPGYTIIQPGDSILIKLVTTSLFGCKSDSTSTRFYTFPVPVTDFTASDTVGCGPLSVTFTNTTPNPGSFNFNWNFGNGVTSSAVNPGTIIFQPNPTAGDTIYNVSLAAYTQCDTIIKVVPIRVKSRPRAIITPDKTYGCSPLTVVFNNISLGVNMTFEWNFGDGTPSFFTNNTSPVSHTYNTAQQDTFYVRLIATNDCGSDTGFYNIVVAARTINLDVAINGNQTTGCAPHAVRFFNNSTGATNFVWDFGDGNLRSTTNNIDTIDHSYLTTGTFSVVIRASNGCTDTSITETISVFAKPLVNFSALPSPVCVGDTVFFTNQTDTATGFLWNFGDGITSQLTNPVHAYQTPGTYDVKLIGIRQYAPGNACTDSIIKQITVVATLPGSFAVSDSIGDCIPFNVTFTSQTFPSALTTWNFGNGAVDTGNVVNYTFTNPGTFIVTMTVRDPDGCTYVATRNIIVNGPTGSFIYDNGFICGNTPVRFEANTTGTDSIRWNFGDGTFLMATSNVVYHTYSQSGVYVPSAELISGTNGNCRRTIIGGDTIRVDYVNAGFTSTQLRLCGSTTVNFNDTSRSYFPMQTWQWNFGDGNSSGVRHPNHTYTSTNTWPIQLIATSSSGCADTTIAPVFVKVDVKPEASIVHDPVGCVNQPVTYNSVVISPDPITYYSWTFSNLASGNTATVTNNYAAPGNYTAQLITGTSFGCYDTVTSTITINPSPFVNTSPNMVICRGESAEINTTGGLTYTWAPFTGLSCNNCPNPIASPLTTTQYVVSGFNSFGCAARDTILITVPQPIDVTATANTVMCIGDTVQLNATGAASYVWSPANTLNNANIPNPIATPPATTVYRVIGFDGYNCFEDTAYITVGVGNYPVVNVGIDRLVATGELINLAPTVTNGPIAIWNWTPPTDLSCATCPSPIATAKKEICYTVTATNFFGCSGSDTMCIRVFCESSQVFIPNAFTPDADGINDVLVVKAQGVKAVKSFRIFNRWGQMVFEKSNFPPNIESFGWDGKVKGIAAPPDVYVYTCEVLCENDVPYTYKGNTAILK